MTERQRDRDRETEMVAKGLQRGYSFKKCNLFVTPTKPRIILDEVAVGLQVTRVTYKATNFFKH